MNEYIDLNPDQKKKVQESEVDKKIARLYSELDNDKLKEKLLTEA